MSIGIGVSVTKLRQMFGSRAVAVTAEKTFSQTAHGLSAGDAAYWDGSWKAARANASTTLAEAVVTAAADADTLTVCLINGAFATITGHGLGSAGATLYLSASVAGTITTTEPSGGGEYSQVIGQVIDADTLAIHSLGAEGPL